MAINCEAKTHVIDGVTYVEVDRKAEVGEKVLIVGAWGTGGKYGNGSVLEVNDLMYGGIVSDAAKTEPNECNGEGYVSHREYVVLERAKPTLTELTAKCTTENRHEEVFAESLDVTDLLASLSRKIVSLEQQLRDTQGNVEKLSQELANARHRIAKHEDRFAAVEDKVEMVLDDIVTLDERSQVLNAINKYYAEGSR